MATFVELTMDAGTDWSEFITLTDDNTGNLINITGYGVLSQMRKSYYSNTGTINLTSTITDAPNGNLAISMTSSNTANIFPGRYVFDVRIADLTNIRTRVLEGIITVTPMVST